MSQWQERSRNSYRDVVRWDHRSYRVGRGELLKKESLGGKGGC